MSISRRRFLTGLVGTAGAVGVAMVVGIPVIEAQTVDVLSPPSPFAATPVDRIQFQRQQIARRLGNVDTLDGPIAIWLYANEPVVETMYTATGQARQIPSQNWKPCLEAGMSFECPRCFMKHPTSDVDPSVCPKWTGAQESCLDCGKRFFAEAVCGIDPSVQVLALLDEHRSVKHGYKKAA